MKTIFLLISIIWSSIILCQNAPIISGDVMLCPNENGTAIVENAEEENYDTYQWYYKWWFTEDPFVAIGNANESTFTYDWQTYDQSLFKVVATKDGVEYESNTIQIDSYSWLPLFFIIESEEDNLVFDRERGVYLLCENTEFQVSIPNPPYDSFQWYRNEVEIESSTEGMVIISEAGNYKVQGAPSFCPNSISEEEFDVEIVACNMGVDESELNNGLSLYPNPTSDFINISGREIIESVQIYSMSGSVIFNNKAFNQKHVSIDVSNLDKGTYIALIHTASASISKKFIIK